MPIPNPDQYLNQAEHLIGFAGGRQGEYRRAISTAYYAVFHVVMRAAADHYIGRPNQKSPEYAIAYRQIDHLLLKNVCAEFTKSSGQNTFRGVSEDLRAFAGAVVESNQQRNRADYDPTLDLRASHTRTVVATARDAVERFRHLSQEQKLKFLFRLMVKTKERPS